MAIGKVPAGMIEEIAGHFTAKFRVPIKALAPIGSDRLAFDEPRSQMVADRLIQAVRFRHPTLAKNARTRVGRSPSRCAAAIGDSPSCLYARMDPANLGQRRDDALLRQRLRKMIVKNIGIMYFGLPASDNPRSALFRNVLGVEDLDRMTEEFDPK